MIRLQGFKLFWAERRAHRDTKAAYDSLVIAHQRALAELAAESCRDCDTLRDHVDVLEKDNARLEWENEQWRCLWGKSVEPMGGLDS